MKNYEDVASDVADEAEALTEQDCAQLNIECWQYDEEGRTQFFTEKAQEIFDEYFDELIQLKLEIEHDEGLEDIE